MVNSSMPLATNPAGTAKRNEDDIAELQESIAKSLNAAKIKWFRYHLSMWGKQNLRDFPWRRTCNPYAILIAEFLLQKTDAATVAPIYETFLLRYSTIDKLLKATVEELGELLEPLGLFFRS